MMNPPARRWTPVILAMMALVNGCLSAKPGTSRAKTDNRVIEAAAVPAASINRGSVLTDLTGGDLGLGGGYLIAAAPEKIQRHQQKEALAAAEKGEQSPVTLQQVHDSDSADLNNDGFITLDEVLAMARAGLSDRDIQDRLEKTHYVFHLTPQQERYLTDRGVTQRIVGVLYALSGRPDLAAKS